MASQTNPPSESGTSDLPSATGHASDRLDSWKEIAAYLRRSERTVRRWEATEGLPTHRHGHHRRASVYAFRGELDQWWATRGAIAATKDPEVAVPRSGWPWGRIAVAMALLFVAAGAILLLYRWRGNAQRDSDLQAETWRSSAVTSYPGAERFPSLSPDGERVVFAWHRETTDNYDIYVQLVQGGTPLQLTSDPLHDWSPAWSPVGSSIAFIRFSPGRDAELFVIPSLPGAERRVATIAPLPGRGPICGGYLAWSPNGAWLAVSDKEPQDDASGLFLVSPVTGEKRRLTRPGRGQRDMAPAFAPHGRALAFVRVMSFGISEIFQVQLAENGDPVGDPRQVTAAGRLSTSPAWNASGTEILFSSGEVFTDRQLYRAVATPGADAGDIRRVSAEIPDSTVFTVDRDATALLYVREFFDPNVWMLERSRTGDHDSRVRTLHLDRCEPSVLAGWLTRRVRVQPDG